MKTIATLFLLSLALPLTGCNTVKGMGRDIGQAGNAIQRAAQ